MRSLQLSPVTAAPVLDVVVVVVLAVAAEVVAVGSNPLPSVPSTSPSLASRSVYQHSKKCRFHQIVGSLLLKAS